MIGCSYSSCCSRRCLRVVPISTKALGLCVNTCTIRNNRLEIQQRREKLWTLFVRGMKRYDIAKELGVDPISRDTAYLVAQSRIV
jgi:hypothetical protein